MPRAGVVERRDHDDGDVSQAGFRAKTPAKGRAIDQGQGVLGDDEIRQVQTRGRERGHAVGHSENVIAVALEHAEQRGLSSFVVIGN